MTASSSTLTKTDRQKAAICMAGILICNSSIGSRHQWRLLRYDRLAKVVKDHDHRPPVTHVKRQRLRRGVPRGSLGWYFPQGTMTALTRFFAVCKRTGRGISFGIASGHTSQQPLRTYIRHFTSTYLNPELARDSLDSLPAELWAVMEWLHFRSLIELYRDSSIRRLTEYKPVTSPELGIPREIGSDTPLIISPWKSMTSHDCSEYAEYFRVWSASRDAELGRRMTHTTLNGHVAWCSERTSVTSIVQTRDVGHEHGDGTLLELPSVFGNPELIPLGGCHDSNTLPCQTRSSIPTESTSPAQDIVDPDATPVPSPADEPICDDMGEEPASRQGRTRKRRVSESSSSADADDADEFVPDPRISCINPYITKTYSFRPSTHRRRS